MPHPSRRKTFSYALIGLPGLVAACGTGQAQGKPVAMSDTPAPLRAPAPAPSCAPAAAPSWNVGAELALFADAISAFDLNRTLPLGVARGGRFGVSAAGAALPDGVSLSAAGLMLAGSQTLAGSVANIVFTYEEP